MSDILGHDIDGRPLRVGDEVIVVGLRNDADMNGKFVVITGPHFWRVNCFQIAGYQRALYGDNARKTAKDHRPADQSYGEIMRGLKQSNRTGVKA